MALRDLVHAAANGATGTATGAASAFKGLTSDPLIWIIRMVFMAGVLAVWMHSGATPFGWEQLVFALLLGLAALSFEYLGSTRMTRAWFERSAFGILGWAIVWAGAFAYSANAWLGVASEGQAHKGNIHKAASITFVDAREDLTRTNRDLDHERANVERLRLASTFETTIGNVKVTTPQAADAIIAKANAHRFWNMTNQCAETRGPQTRAFCEEYRSAVAARASALDALARKEELKAAEEKVAELESKASKAKQSAAAAPVVTSTDRDDLRILTRYANMSAETAADTQAILKVIVISLFLSLAGFLREAEHHRDLPRKPWGISAWLRRLWNGPEKMDPAIRNRLMAMHDVRHDNGILAPRMFHGATVTS